MLTNIYLHCGFLFISVVGNDFIYIVGFYLLNLR